jgi:RNA polymerase sigma factor (sigma-70 family)
MITSFATVPSHSKRCQSMGSSADKILQVTVVSPDGEVVVREKFEHPTTVSFGRGVDCDIRLENYGKKLSRCHAVLIHDGTEWEFYNLGINGSYESGKQIDSAVLDGSRVIRLGKRGPIIQFKFKEPPLPTDQDTDTAEDTEDGSGFDEGVTDWIRQIKAGDEEAAQRLWDRYADDIVEVARNSLRDSSRRVHDEEDVAIVAFRSLLAGISAGRFKGLDRREQLWRLLMVITTRKAAALIDRDLRQKRGGGNVRGDSAMVTGGSSQPDPGFDRLESENPTPDLAAIVADETQQLIASLDDELAQRVAVLKMEGYTHEEIAKQLQCTTRTVERRIKQIREHWQHLVDEPI